MTKVTARKRLQGFFQYWAALTQADTSAPTDLVRVSDIGDVTLARSEAGVYTLTKTGRFPVGTIVDIQNNSSNGLHIIKAERTSANVITIRTFLLEKDGGNNPIATPTDAILSATPIRIMIPLV